MKRILQVVSSLKRHGTETFIMNVFREFCKSGEIIFDFLVFDDSREGFYDEVISNGSNVYYIPPRRKGMVKFHKNLDDFFRDHFRDYVGVHFHATSLTTLAPLFFAKKYGIPLRIMHIHGADCKGFHNKMFHRFNRLRISFIGNTFLSCSQQAAEWGFKGSNVLKFVKVIPNGIDLNKFEFNLEGRIGKREELGLGRNEMIAIHVGRLDPVKNHHFLIDIIANLKERGKTIKLLCVGQGPMLKELTQHTREKNLKDNILFLGSRTDISDLLSASDLMLFPSLNEGLGIAPIEAQANGLPVVASDILPYEANASFLFQPLPLNIGVSPWVSEILDIINKIQPLNEKMLSMQRKQPKSLQSFSITNTVSQLQEIYTKTK